MKVTIGVCAYRAAGTLRRCLDSILAQDYRPLQLIAVDDGSDDDTGAILTEYAAKARSQGIEVTLALFGENRGLAARRIDVIREAQGEYLTWVDADDWIEPDAVQSYVRATDGGKVDVVTAGYTQHESKRERQLLFPQDEKFDLETMPLNTLYFSLWNKLIRLSLLRENPGHKVGLNYWEDLGQTARIFALHPTIKIIPRTLYHFAVNAGSMTHTRTQRIVEERIGVARELCAWFEAKGLTAEYPRFLQTLKLMAKANYLRRLPGGLGPFRRTFPEASRHVLRLRTIPLARRLLLAAAGFML